MTKWVKLKKGNDWGNIYVSDNPMTSYGSCDIKLAVKPINGETIPVKWPNGKVQNKVIKFRTNVESVSDMGNSYNVTSSVPGFYHDVMGQKTWFDLDSVSVKSDWIELRKENSRV